MILIILPKILWFKLNVTDPTHAQIMQHIITKHLLEPRVEKLKEKQVCVLFLQAGDDISVMTEEDMKSSGWEKKEKSLIILPK